MDSPSSCFQHIHCHSWDQFDFHRFLQHILSKWLKPNWFDKTWSSDFLFQPKLKSIYILSKFEHLKTNRSAARCSRKCYFSSLMWTRTLQILLILHDIDHVILIAMAFSTTVCWALTWPSPSSTTPNRPWKKKWKNQRLLAGHPHDDHLTKNKKSQQTRTTRTTQ